MALTDDLVLCTRNRPDEVAACLASVRAQRRVPNCVLVVDSSDDDTTGRVVEGLRAGWPAGKELRHAHSEPGLTHQRAVGLGLTAHDIVHFLDDDTVLEPGYFEGIVAAFVADATGAVGGVGGTITNQPEHRWRRVDVWLGLDSPREGVVLASGRNVRVHRAPPAPLDVDWLPGCAMSYRRAVLVQHPLDPDAAFHSEDVQLSYRVRQTHRLVITPHARLRHEEVADGRLSGAPLVEREILARWQRVQQGTGGYSRRAFWVSVWGQLVRYGVPALLTWRPERRAVVQGTWRAIRAIRRAG